jgi:hypothetical protein
MLPFRFARRQRVDRERVHPSLELCRHHGVELRRQSATFASVGGLADAQT